MNNELLKKVILGVLFALAIFLAFLLYKENRPESVSMIKDEVTPAKIDSELFSDDERKLLAPPGPDASKEEKDVHSQLAAKLSVAGEKVSIKDCQAEPIVLRTNFGNSVTFENKDSSGISISFDNQNMLEIAGGKSITTKEAFVHGPGLYGYLCVKDGFKGLVGFIILTQ